MKSFKVVASLLLALTAAAWAQDRPAARASQARERARENINNLRLLRMTQILELDEGQTARIYPFFNRVEKEKAELQMALTAELRDLRASVRQPPFDDGRILEAIRTIRDLQDGIRAKEMEFETFLAGVLTPSQQGRYLIFMVDFYRNLGENLERLRQAAPKIKRGS